MNQIRKIAPLFVSFLALSATLWSQEGSWELRGRVTIGREMPLSKALVRAQIPGRTIVTMTDDRGHYVLKLPDAPKILLSILLDGKLLKRYFIEPQSQAHNIVLDIHPIRNLLPIDVALQRDSSVIILEETGRILRFGNSSLNFVWSVDSGTVTSVQVGRIQGVETILLTFERTPLLRSVLGLSLEGQRVNEWALGFVPGSPGATALDEQNQTLYVLFPETRMIYDLALDSGRLRQVRQVYLPPVGRLNGLSLDQHGRVLYICSNAGELYSINLSSRRLKNHGRRFSSIDAIWYDAEGNTLIVVEAKRKIWELVVNDQENRQLVYDGSKTGSRDIGAVVARGGRIWFSDRSRHCLVEIDRRSMRATDHCFP